MKFLLYIAFFISFCGFSQGTVGLLYEEIPTDSVPKISVAVHTGYLPQTRLTNKIADSTTPEITLKKLEAIMSARTNLSHNAAPLLTIEALMVLLK